MTGRQRTSQHSRSLHGDGAAAPTIARLLGADLVSIANSPHPSLPTILAYGLAKTTMAEHRRSLAQLAHLPADLLGAPADVALVEWLSRRRKQRKWRWATATKNAACAQGAFRLLPMYRTTAHPGGVNLALSPVWRQFVKAITKLAKEQLPRQPRAATSTQVEAVLQLHDIKVATRMVVLLGWTTTQRIGCIRQLSKSDITCHEQTRTLTIRFRRGKVVASRGPYSIHTAPLAQHHWLTLQGYIASAPEQLFSQVLGAEVKLALRRVDQRLEQRSLRRGAIQTLAAQPGMTNEVLLAYTGHTSLASLFRYLNWGSKARHQACVVAQVAGDALLLD